MILCPNNIFYNLLQGSDVDSVAHLESFRVLKLTLLESFRALKLLKPYWRFLEPESSHNWIVSGPFYSPF